MKVVQVSPRYFPNLGGVDIVVRKLSELLVERGVHVTVLSMDLGGRTRKKERINGVVVKRFRPLAADPLFLPPPAFIKAVRREDIDIIHVHNAHTFLPILVAFAKRRKARMLLQPHYHRYGQTIFRNSLLRLHQHALNKLVSPRVRFTIVNSCYEMRIVQEDFRSFKDVVLIQEGMSSTELGAIKWRPETPKRILSIGALRKYKKVDMLLEAFAYVAKAREEPFKLVIVGDGPENEHLKSLSRKLGVEDSVEWKQNLSRRQLLEEYSKASVFVSLSQLESFSRVVHEAIMIGVPTVAPNFGATAKMVTEGLVEGVAPLNPKAIADTILRVAIKPQKVAESPRAFLSWGEYLNRILEVYRRALSN